MHKGEDEHLSTHQKYDDGDEHDRESNVIRGCMKLLEFLRPERKEVSSKANLENTARKFIRYPRVSRRRRAHKD